MSSLASQDIVSQYFTNPLSIIAYIGYLSRITIYTDIKILPLKKRPSGRLSFFEIEISRNLARSAV